MKTLFHSSFYSSICQLATAGSFAALLLAAAPASRAATKTYFGPDNGVWSAAANWNPSGVPVGGDDVVLGSHTAGTADLHVTFDINYNATSLNSLTLNSSALAGFMIFNQTSGSTGMAASTESIGTTTADNTYNQSAGSNVLHTNLALQPGLLQMGVTASSTNNTYNLSGSAALTADDETIGVAGAGAFNQSGGTNTVHFVQGSFAQTGYLTLGGSAGGSGGYTLSGGTLDVHQLVVASGGTGTFSQTNGSAVFDFVDVSTSGGGSGTLTQSGGTASTTTLTRDRGALAQTCGERRLRSAGHLHAGGNVGE